MNLPTLHELRLRWTLYGPLPRCTTDDRDSDWGWHCWGLIWPWQRQDGHMHARCRPPALSSKQDGGQRSWADYKPDAEEEAFMNAPMGTPEEGQA